MCLDRVDEQRDKEGVYAVHRELSTLCHSSRNDGGTCSAEHGLEHQLTGCRQSGGVVIPGEVTEVGHAHESGAVVAEHDAETYKPEQYGTDHEIDEVLEEYVGSVLTSCESSFTQGKSRLHEEYQHCGQQQPHGIYRYR